MSKAVALYAKVLWRSLLDIQSAADDLNRAGTPQPQQDVTQAQVACAGRRSRRHRTSKLPLTVMQAVCTSGPP